MAKRKPETNSATTEPRFPYVPNANAVRKFLKLVPNKPKPPRVTQSLLKSWGLTSSGDRAIIRVLKAINFIGPSGETTSVYETFMHPTTGPATLGAQIKTVYAPLFQSSHEPYKEPNEDLKRLFHIHSGGTQNTITWQVQTFKALCEFASFDAVPPGAAGPAASQTNGAAGSAGGQKASQLGSASVHIDLHIHLPENKTTRDYEAIIQDIARYIYKQEVDGNGR